MFSSGVRGADTLVLLSSTSSNSVDEQLDRLPPPGLTLQFCNLAVMELRLSSTMQLALLGLTELNIGRQRRTSLDVVNIDVDVGDIK